MPTIIETRYAGDVQVQIDEGRADIVIVNASHKIPLELREARSLGFVLIGLVDGLNQRNKP